MILGTLEDKRALAGATALIIVGAHLSIMMGFYFYPGDNFRLMQARWWWEISLNIQILCLVLMWICHSERMREATGWRKVRAVLRFIVGMGGSAIPAFVLFLYASNGWRENQPDGMELAYYAALVFVGWVIAAYIVPLLIALVFQRLKYARLSAGAHDRQSLLQLAPFGTLVLLGIIEVLRGGNMHYVMWPFFTYLHGAVPYLLKAYSGQPSEQSVSDI